MALSAVVLGAVFGSTTPAQYQTTVELGLVVVTAFGDNGEPIQDLTPEDLQVYEDDVLRPVRLLIPPEAGSDLSIVVDNSRSVRGYARGFMETLAELGRKLPSTACARIIFAADEVRPTPWTRVQRLADQPPLNVSTTPGSRILDAVAQALRPPPHPHAGCSHLEDDVGQRPTIVVVLTDLADQASETSIGELQRLIDIHPARLHALVVGKPPVVIRKAFDPIATSSGGEISLLRTQGDLSDAIRRIVTTARASYLVGFEPRRDPGSQRRGLRVETTRPGIVLAHKTSYLVSQ